MLYQWFELSHAAVQPARAAADTCHTLLKNPFNPIAHSKLGQHAAAACEVFERSTRRYEKPQFEIARVNIDGQDVALEETVIWQKPFCRLLHFKRQLSEEQNASAPRVLLVAPMSGHFATLLRGTVETLLPDHDVYITDWSDARTVPASAGRFDLDDYIDYLIDMLALFNGDVHVIGVCQPSVPVLAAIARMEADKRPDVPLSMTLIGGPIDTRINPTAVNKVAETRSLDWFRNNVISHVPWPLPGAGRSVYPGFLQLSGFMSMNLNRHAQAHHDFFNHLVEGDGDSAEKHREFYDEYLAVMDLTAEFYLQTIDTVFISHALANGTMRHRDVAVEPDKIRRVALMTIEGEKDDITGLGQTRAAHDLCQNIPETARHTLIAPGVGHYGLFNGSKFRTEIAPHISQFIRCHDPRWDQASCALLRSTQNSDNSGQTGPQCATGTAATENLPSGSVAIGQTSTAIQNDNPLQTAVDLWQMSHGTMLKSAWRLCLPEQKATATKKRY